MRSWLSRMGEAFASVIMGLAMIPFSLAAWFYDFTLSPKPLTLNPKPQCSLIPSMPYLLLLRHRH